MSEPYVGEIRMFAGNFIPRGWASCDGRLLDVSQNNALFSLYGTTYGGDGRTTFGLPDMRGRNPVHAGQGPGLVNRNWGSTRGQERVLGAPRQVITSVQVARDLGNTATSTDVLKEGDIGTPSLCIHFIVALLGIYPTRT